MHDLLGGQPIQVRPDGMQRVEGHHRDLLTTARPGRRLQVQVAQGFLEMAGLVVLGIDLDLPQRATAAVLNHAQITDMAAPQAARALLPSRLIPRILAINNALRATSARRAWYSCTCCVRRPSHSRATVRRRGPTAQTGPTGFTPEAC